MLNKFSRRKRRVKKVRAQIKRLGKVSLSIHRTPRHIYAQLIDHRNEDAKILAAVSTVQKEIKSSLKYTGNIEAAKTVGKKIAELAKNLGIKEVAFDRSGFQYHGRVKSLAEAAREAGLEF